jgi:outer membrane protein OmpA-like peptidoglycan-associated protein
MLGITSLAQVKTDLRVIDEEARYSREKKFKTWSLSAGFGPVIPFTDINNYTLFPSNNLNMGWSASIAKQLYPSFAFELQFLKSDMYGEKGNFYFKGDVMDFTLNLQTYLNQMINFPGPYRDHWDFYLKIGIGMQAFRSRLHNMSDGSIVKVSDFSGEATDTRHVVLGYDKQNPNRKITRKGELVLPLGAGVLYRINNSFDVGIESTLRFSFEDNMDNVLIGATNDRYWYSAVNLHYNFGQKGKRHSKWTYRSYGFNIFGKPKKDPLLSEVEELEDRIKTYEENRPVKHDSVFIYHSAKKIYSRNNIHQVFFTSKSSNVDRAFHDELAQVVIKLLTNKDWKAEIIGYSDETDENADNMEISKKRCDEVADKLINDLGIDPQRIIITPKGNSELLSPTSQLSPRGLHFINRRVDIIIRK